MHGRQTPPTELHDRHFWHRDLASPGSFELGEQSRLALHSCLSYFCFQRAGITFMHRYTRGNWVLDSSITQEIAGWERFCLGGGQFPWTRCDGEHS